MLRIAILIVAIMTWPHAAALPQRPDAPGAEHLGTSSGEVWGGYSPGSTSAGFLGRHADLKLWLGGLRVNHRIRKADTGFVYYTFDVIPVARVTPLIVYTTDAADRCQAPYFDCVRVQKVVHGFGLNPLGVTIIRRADRAMQWRFGANAGFLMFDHPTPSDIAARFNYTAAIEAGVQFVRPTGAGWMIVYRLHHLSNAGQAEDNLAMLSHVLSIGARWRFSR